MMTTATTEHRAIGHMTRPPFCMISHIPTVDPPSELELHGADHAKAGTLEGAQLDARPGKGPEQVARVQPQAHGRRDAEEPAEVDDRQRNPGAARLPRDREGGAHAPRRLERGQRHVERARGLVPGAVRQVGGERGVQRQPGAMLQRRPAVSARPSVARWTTG